MAERKQNGKKETKHVNNAESKKQKNKSKVRQKGRRHFLTGVWVWRHQKHGKANKDLKADGGWGEDSLKHASPAVHTRCVNYTFQTIPDIYNTKLLERKDFFS